MGRKRKGGRKCGTSGIRYKVEGEGVHRDRLDGGRGEGEVRVSVKYSRRRKGRRALWIRGEGGEGGGGVCTGRLNGRRGEGLSATGRGRKGRDVRLLRKGVDSCSQKKVKKGLPIALATKDGKERCWLAFRKKKRKRKGAPPLDRGFETSRGNDPYKGGKQEQCCLGRGKVIEEGDAGSAEKPHSLFGTEFSKGRKEPTSC